MTNPALLLRAFLQPQVLVRGVIRSLSLGSVEFRLAMQALEKAQYAFGIRQAIYLASRLSHSRVAVIEFGVGAGGGLKLMEQYAAELGKSYSVHVEVYGFDLGSGLPTPSSYRDLPYAWRAGDYPMDIPQLQRSLTTAKLLLGDLRETLPKFIESGPATVGFISFDLDYYTSTIAAFSIFNVPDELILPRVLCYFDDVGSDERQMHCEYVGELLAISEFNSHASNGHKLCHTYIHSPGVKFPASWLHQLWVYHRFSRQDYDRYVRG